MQQSATGPALKMHFDLRQDVRSKFMAKQDTLLSLANIHAVNESGQSSVDIDRVNHQVVNVEAVNFRLPGQGGNFCDHSWLKSHILELKITAFYR